MKSMRIWQAIKQAVKTVFPVFEVLGWTPNNSRKQFDSEIKWPQLHPSGFSWGHFISEWNCFQKCWVFSPTALQIRPLFPWMAVCLWILGLLSWKFCLEKIAVDSGRNQVIQWSFLAKSSLYALGLILNGTDIAGLLLVPFSCRALHPGSNDLQRASNGRVYCVPLE